MKQIKLLLSRGILWIYGMISVYPLLWLVFYSLKTNDQIFFTNPFGIPTELHFENYVKALSRYNVARYFFNSTVVSVITIVFVVLLSLMFAYATARLEWKLRDAARIFVIIGMFIPIQVILIPIAILVRDLHLTNSYLSLILPYIAFNLAFSTMVFYASFRNLPQELEEASCIDGAGIFRTFFHIMVPIVKPAIATVVIFVFLSSWNEFTLALILISKETLKTLPLGLLFFQGRFTTDWGAMGAAMVIASLPTVVMYIIFSNQVEKAFSIGGAVKG